MSATTDAILALSLLSVVTTSFGVLLAVRLRDNDAAITAGIGFATGIMLLISLMELVPASIHLLGALTAARTFALGAALIWLVNRAVPHIHFVAEKGLTHSIVIRSAFLVAFGLILHDVPEGFAMANAYLASPDLGVLVAIGIALHNAPEEFAIAVPAVLVRGRRFLYGAALLSALAEPLGAVVGLLVVGIAPQLNVHFLAFAAGAMTFVSLHELVPMARRYRNTRMFLAGVLVSALVYALLGLVSEGP